VEGLGRPSDPGGDDLEPRLHNFSSQLNLAGRADDAVDSAILSKKRKSLNLFVQGLFPPHLKQSAGIQAREHRDGNHGGFSLAELILEFFGSSFHHFESTRRMTR